MKNWKNSSKTWVICEMWPGITRFARVCLRFDDYHQNYDVERWERVLSRYEERGLKGVVGVVPEDGGDRLDGDVVDFLRGLRDSGWELAQHGYTHEDIGEGRGGLLYDDRSEFCGVPREEQRRRVGAGRDILQSHGIEPVTFIPPWHEYDRNTVRVLGEEGFHCLNEGRLPRTSTTSGISM